MLHKRRARNGSDRLVKMMAEKEMKMDPWVGTLMILMMAMRDV